MKTQDAPATLHPRISAPAARVRLGSGTAAIDSPPGVPYQPAPAAAADDLPNTEPIPQGVHALSRVALGCAGAVGNGATIRPPGRFLLEVLP